MVVFENGSVVNFGSPEYENFTMHRDSDRKRLYILRHQTREDWNDIKTAGFWSKNLLWNSPSLSASIRDTEKRLMMKV